MSSDTKRPYAEALANAEKFRDLFMPMFAEAWTIAGSIRRHRPMVGDVEHVVIPKFGEAVPLGSMFPERCNLLWHRMEELVHNGPLTKAVYGEGETVVHALKGVSLEIDRGEIFGVPLFIDAGMLYWRTDLMDGPPTSLSALAADWAGDAILAQASTLHVEGADALTEFAAPDTTRTRFCSRCGVCCVKDGAMRAESV